MPPQIKLSTRLAEGLAIIREVVPEKLDAVKHQIEAAKPRPLMPRQLLPEIARASDKGEDEAEQVLQTLLALQTAIRQRHVSADVVLEEIQHGIQNLKNPPWDQQQQEKWRSIQGSLKSLITSPALRLVSATLGVMYEYENLFLSSRIVTDIRPVFSEDIAEIEGAAVSHTLHIRYSSNEDVHRMSVAMDEADIQELEKQCQRALAKARTARRVMLEQAGVSTVITGGLDDAEG